MIHFRLEQKGNSLFVLLSEPNSRRIFYLDTLKAAAKGNEIQAVDFLIQQHLKANPGKSKDTLSFQEILLTPSISNRALSLLSETATFFYRGKKIGKGGKKSLYWKGDKISEKSAHLSPYLDAEKLEEVDLLSMGTSPWAIVKNEWVEIDSNISWKWIEAFSKGPLMLEGISKKNFLEEDPKILWKAKPIVELKVMPCLELSDFSGSFANLWMEYPGFGKVAFEDLAPHISNQCRLKNEEAGFEKDLIEVGFIRKIVGSSRYYCPSEKVYETLKFLLEMGWSVVDFKGKKILLQSNAHFSLFETDAFLHIQGKLEFQSIEGSLQKAQMAMEKKSHFLELDSKHVGLLDAKSIPQIGGDWEAEILCIEKSRVGEIIPLLKDGKWTVEDGLKKSLFTFEGGEGESLLEHDRFLGKLLPYQEKGVRWLQLLYRWRLGALLADEMGLGKTVQVLAFFSSLRTNLPILIVAPTSLLFNWEKEMQKFWKEIGYYVHSGPQRVKCSKYIQNQSVILTSYALLRQDLALFSSISLEAVALDESQAIKSYDSQIFKAASSLNGKFKIAITGTPLENRKEELWAQMHFLIPNLLGTKTEFLKLPSEMMRKKIAPFLLRRKKTDVQIDLPEKIDTPIWVEMAEDQKILYEKTLHSFKNGLLQKVKEEGLSAHRMEVLEVILRLRQIASEPRLLGLESKGAKAETLLSSIQELRDSNKKSIIFSQFTSTLQLLRKDLLEMGIEPLYLDGSISKEQRGEIVCRFQEESQPHVFLISLKAGGVGLNLTAAEAVFLFDPWWNEAVEKQAIDRAHRLGQKNTLFVFRYLTPNTIEEKMVELKAHKSSQSADILDHETGSIELEDLLQII